MNLDARKHEPPQATLAISQYLGLTWLAISEPLKYFSFQGVVTAVAGVISVLALPALVLRALNKRESFAASTTWSWLVIFFEIWVVERLVTGSHGITPGGIQNVLVFAIFCSAGLGSQVTDRYLSEGDFLRKVRDLALVGTILSVAMNYRDLSFASRFVGMGAVTGVALIGLIAARCMPYKSKFASGIEALFFAIIMLSASRAYLLFTAVFIALPRYSSKSSHRTQKSRALTTFIRLILAVTAFFLYGPIKDRFAQNDGASLGGIVVGTSGRSALWNVLLSNLDGQSLIGHGAGASQDLVAVSFNGIAQPHNDYLRILFDYGPIGLVLWCSVVLFMIAYSLRVLVSRISSGIDHSLPLATLVLCILLATFQFLDNVVIYVFMIAPIMVSFGYLVNLQGRLDLKLLK